MAINSSTAIDDQSHLSDRCSFPLFQNLSDIGAWGMHGGAKDDFFVYDSEGKLSAYLGAHGELSINLSTAEGYGNLKVAVLDAMEQQ